MKDQMEKRTDDDDEDEENMKKDIQRLKMIIENHCHCLHVDQLREEMHESEEQIIHIAKDF